MNGWVRGSDKHRKADSRLEMFAFYDTSMIAITNSDHKYIKYMSFNLVIDFPIFFYFHLIFIISLWGSKIKLIIYTLYFLMW